MNPGILKNKIEIWGNQTVDNELMEESYNPVVLKTCWAEIIPKTGTLLNRQADTIVSKTTHVIKIRYNSYPNLKPDNWIIYKEHKFDIDYILNPYFKNVTLEIFVHEVIE